MQQFVAVCTTVCANAPKGREGCISSRNKPPETSLAAPLASLEGAQRFATNPEKDIEEPFRFRLSSGHTGEPPAFNRPPGTPHHHHHTTTLPNHQTTKPPNHRTRPDQTRPDHTTPHHTTPHHTTPHHTTPHCATRPQHTDNTPPQQHARTPAHSSTTPHHTPPHPSTTHHHRNHHNHPQPLQPLHHHT